MAVVRAQGAVPLRPDRAMALWLDPQRWPTWVEGFAHVAKLPDGWPAEPGAKLFWQSRPGGRGQVMERVVEYAPPHRFVGDVFEDRLMGRQSVTFSPANGGCIVAIELQYALTEAGPLGAIADFLFIRPRLSEAQRRTLRRFATEAAEESALHA